MNKGMKKINVLSNEQRNKQIKETILKKPPRSKESGVGSRESGVGSRESGVGNRESGIGSQDEETTISLKPLLRQSINARSSQGYEVDITYS